MLGCLLLRRHVAAGREKFALCIVCKASGRYHASSITIEIKISNCLLQFVQCRVLSITSLRLHFTFILTVSDPRFRVKVSGRAMSLHLHLDQQPLHFDNTTRSMSQVASHTPRLYIPCRSSRSVRSRQRPSHPQRRIPPETSSATLAPS